MTLTMLIGLLVGYMLIGEVSAYVFKGLISSLDVEDDVKWAFGVGVRFVWVLVLVVVLLISVLIIGRRLRSP